MAYHRILAVVGFVLVLGVAPGVQTAELSPINFVSSGSGGIVEVIRFSQKQGFFKKQGLDVTMIYVPSGVLAAQTVVSGSALIANNSVSDILNAIAAGAPLKILTVNIDRFQHLFVARPGINSPKDMDLYRNDEFIFNSPFVFRERFADEEGYFSGPGKRYEIRNVATWDTNFIADVSSAAIDTCEEKGVGALITCFEIAGNSLVGHLSQWPAGLYHKAHYHGPGSVLFGLQSNGYVLLWSKDMGARPYESGNGDGVVEMSWKDGSVYCPPGGWFHQHFNIGSEPARQLAIRFGGRVHPTGFATAAKRHDEGVLMSIKNGGTLLEYEDEDPEIRRRFESKLKSTGVRCEMPQFARL